MLQGIVEDVYCRYMGQHCQRQGQGHLGESRVLMTRMSCAMWGEAREAGEGEKKKAEKVIWCNNQESKSTKKGR